VAQFTTRNKATCKLIMDGSDFDKVLDDERATSVFRIVQESLANVSRHAYASHVKIRMYRDEERLFITIADDGVGAYSNNLRKPRSFGLIGIRERVHNLNGEFKIDSTPGKGTILSFSIPITAPLPLEHRLD
jgi:signal transduction histidine kinase